MSLQQVKDKLTFDLYGQTVNQAVQGGNCIQCKEPALPKCYSEGGRKEFYISGLCEVCFDNMFEEEDNEAEV